MNVGILIATFIVEAILIGGVTWALKIKSDKEVQKDDFVTSNRNLGVMGIACTQGLTSLGAGYVLGMPAAGWSYGVGTWWYMTATGVMFILMLCYTGPWVRRFGFTTINEVWQRMFNRKTSVLMAGIAAGTCFGLMTLEIQGVGTIVSAMTGYPLAAGCLIGGAISILYVVFGGMKQVAWLNIINAVVMYTGAFVALFTLGKYLPNGWEGVNAVYLMDESKEWMLSIWANSETWRTYIIGMFLAVLFYCPIGPAAAQINASAKNPAVIRKSIFWATPMNLLFGAILLAFGIVAMSIEEYAAIPGPPIATMLMLLNLLPNWIVVWIFASFSAAMVSTIAMQMLVMPTSFVKDILSNIGKGVPANKELSYIRWGVVISGILGTALSTCLPAVDSAIVWVFAWLLPSFWLFTFGMFWKRSNRAGVWSMIICGVFNMIWSFTDLAALVHLEGNNNSIGLIVVSLLTCIILTATDKNAKPAYKKLYEQDRKSVVNPEILDASEAAKA